LRGKRGGRVGLFVHERQRIARTFMEAAISQEKIRKKGEKPPILPGQKKKISARKDGVADLKEGGRTRLTGKGKKKRTHREMAEMGGRKKGLRLVS